MKNINLIWGELLETVLLLIALMAFNTALIAVWPLVWANFFTSGYNWVLSYSNWIGDIGFGLIIYYKLRNMRTAVSIGLLSATIPIFGALFYLLAFYITPSANER